jgi:hypothetical protein
MLYNAVQQADAVSVEGLFREAARKLKESLQDVPFFIEPSDETCRETLALVSRAVAAKNALALVTERAGQLAPEQRTTITQNNQRLLAENMLSAISKSMKAVFNADLRHQFAVPLLAESLSVSMRPPEVDRFRGHSDQEAL